MEGLYPITDRDKATAIELIIYDRLDKIDKRVKKWFVDAFIHGKIRIDDAENLVCDLEYIFSVTFWLIDVAENMGFSLQSKRFVIRKYERFKHNEHGYRFLISDERYDAHTNRLLSDGEVVERNERINAEVKKILSEM